MSEIPMADGKNIVKIEQLSSNRLCLTIGSVGTDDMDTVILEDCFREFGSFWLSLPRSDEKDIYILDLNGKVKQVRCKNFKIHVVTEYVGDEKGAPKQWIDSQYDRNLDTYYIYPYCERVDKQEQNIHEREHYIIFVTFFSDFRMSDVG